MSEQELELMEAPVEDVPSTAPEFQTDAEVAAIKEEDANPDTNSKLSEEVN